MPSQFQDVSQSLQCSSPRAPTFSLNPFERIHKKNERKSKILLLSISHEKLVPEEEFPYQTFSEPLNVIDMDVVRNRTNVIQNGRTFF